ncbi:MAG: hypothetical protein EOO14_02540 [Chitinophagaceae bacterium]|nr:MAG: hypothetical protein EOO14_02540 [Chitinophagaceae bacterium]
MAIEVTKRPYTKCFSGNPVHYELYSLQSVSDASIFFEVRVMFKPVGGSYAPLVTLPYYPTNGYAEIDIKDILNSELEYGLVPFFNNEKTAWAAPQQTGFFYLQYREISNLNPNPSWDDAEASHECFVIKGGLNYFKFRGNNFWVNYFPVQKPFLTWQVNGRLAAPKERMYLAFLQTDAIAAGDLRAVAQCKYTDGTFASVAFAAGEAKDQVIYIPAGAEQWALATLSPAKQIEYWEVWLELLSNGALLTEKFRYYWDNRNDYNETVLHYRGSLGGLDSVRVRGVIDEDLSYNYSEQETTITPNYYSGDSIQPQRRITDNTEQNTCKGDIGHLGKEEQDRLRDAYINREVYQSIDKKWWPVIIITKNFKLRRTDSMRWTLPIEWELAYSGGDYYTPRSVDLGDGVFTDNVCRARLSPLTLSWADLGGGFGDLTINGTEVDPQNASLTLRYRILNITANSVSSWFTVFYTDLPRVHGNLPEAVYTVEAQSICGNNVLGAVSSAQINTLPHGGGGGTPTTLNGEVFNSTTIADVMEIRVNGDVVFSGYVGAHNTQVFHVDDETNATVEIVFGGALSPSNVFLESNLNMYYPAAFAATTWTFNNVNITSFLNITIQ